MNYTEFMYWANLADEDKKGKFVAFKDLSEAKYEDIISMMPAVGTNDYLMVPLDCIDFVSEPWLANLNDNVVDVIDVDWLQQYPVLKACNLRSL